ncbi:MAG: diaminopimelate decarboxylase [Candidatus Bathyarchaeota archaeon]|nr:diaminopimelate decarboxylase [Candidatus Bathyarchaeota archaeon]
MALNWPYENRGGYLYVDGVSALDAARRFGTPLYLYSENKIRHQYRHIKEAFSKHYPRSRVLYAAKANTSLSILRILREERAEVAAVSPGEVHAALQAGYKPDQILFTGTSVGLDELLYLLDAGVRMNVDSESQLDRLLEQEVPEMISVRINTENGSGDQGYESQFGVWDEDATAVYAKAKRSGVKRFGVQMHIGSGNHDVGDYLPATKRLLEVAGHVRRETGVVPDFVDLGGGIGVPYKPGEKQVDLDAFFIELVALIRKELERHDLGEPELWVEPGRFLVAEAGVLLTRVTTIKHNHTRRFVGVNAGFNTLVRPAMYGSYHGILAASAMDAPGEVVDVYGPLCELGDLFARDRRLPRVSEGALLVIMNAGAYGFSMASRYNSRPLPAEVMVREGEARLIRERETLGDLLRGQS